MEFYHRLVLALVTGFLILCYVRPSQAKIYVKNVKTKNCGSESDPVHLEEAKISNTDGGISVQLRLQVKENLTNPIKVQYKVQKKAFFIGYVPVGLPGSEGTINDICSLGVPQGQECPEILRESNLPCRCPVQKGEITVQRTFPVGQDLDLMKGFLMGDYLAQLRSWHLDGRLACYDVTFSVS